MLLAFVLTLIAGLSTTIGGLISFFVKKYNVKALALGLGFSAGVMIYISLVELLKEATDLIAVDFGESWASIITTLAFTIGIILSAAIDYFLPEHHRTIENIGEKKPIVPTLRQKKLFRVGLLTFIIVAIHNFPEGMTTFSSALINPALGVPVAIAIAIHNIPEGISVALPVFYSTGSRMKALAYSFLSGASEILGGLFVYYFINFTDFAFSILIAITAGFMVFISFDELLPTAREYGKNHLPVIGVVIGMLTMALSLNVLSFYY